MKKRFLSFAAISLAITMTTQAQGAGERTLHVYHWSDYVAPDTISNFENKVASR